MLHGTFINIAIGFSNILDSSFHPDLDSFPPVLGPLQTWTRSGLKKMGETKNIIIYVWRPTGIELGITEKFAAG